MRLRRCLLLITAMLLMQCGRRTVKAVVASPSFAPRDGIAATDTAPRPEWTTTATAAVTTRLFLRDDPSLGRYVADENGRALYTASADTATTSACKGPCVHVWMPVSPPADAAMSGVNRHRIGAIIRADGTRQVTYGGSPVYRYAHDQMPGEASGNGRRDFGSEWNVLRP